MILSILAPALSCEWNILGYEKALMSTVSNENSQAIFYSGKNYDI